MGGRDIVQGEIKIINRKITLRAGLLKRDQILFNGEWIDTQPIDIIDDKFRAGQIIEKSNFLLPSPVKLLALPAPNSKSLSDSKIILDTKHTTNRKTKLIKVKNIKTINILK